MVQYNLYELTKHTSTPGLLAQNQCWFLYFELLKSKWEQSATCISAHWRGFGLKTGSKKGKSF